MADPVGRPRAVRPQFVAFEVYPVHTAYPYNLPRLRHPHDEQLPTLYASDNESYLVQGWVVTDPDVLARLTVSDAETVVEVLAKLLGFLALDGLHGDVTRVVPPIVMVLDSGNYIVQGTRMVDSEALSQMVVPDYETGVEVPKAAMRALLVGV